MTNRFYSGNGKQRKQGADDFPTPRRSDLIQPEKYLADSGLADAANVAIMLGQPLLLTGEAGTGKTQFAYNLAWELKLAEPFKFETKSTSMARDLFYTYDALKRFQDVQSGLNPQSILPYISFQALGKAILCTRTHTDSEISDLLSVDVLPGEKMRSVVLIDEIDKSPRDFPNDILNEIENMYFRILEMDNRLVAADKTLAPLVVITSNSEKDLPDAFLRRCVYYNIPFPDYERLRQIVDSRLGTFISGADVFIDDALKLFFALRRQPLRKQPSTAEMLSWILTLKDMAPDQKNPLADRTLAQRTLSTLIKNTADQDKAKEIVEKWQNKQA